MPDQDTLSADAEGLSLHAATRVHANERDRLEALIRCVPRPALSQGRLEIRGGGKVKWNLRKPWRDGTRAFVSDTEPGDLATLRPAGMGPEGAHARRSKCR